MSHFACCSAQCPGVRAGDKRRGSAVNFRTLVPFICFQLAVLRVVLCLKICAFLSSNLKPINLVLNCGAPFHLWKNWLCGVDWQKLYWSPMWHFPKDFQGLFWLYMTFSFECLFQSLSLQARCLFSAAWFGSRSCVILLNTCLWSFKAILSKLKTIRKGSSSLYLILSCWETLQK